jgi:hypothetical protein
MVEVKQRSIKILLLHFLQCIEEPYGCNTSGAGSVTNASDASDGPLLPILALTIDVSTERIAAVPETVSACAQSTLSNVDALVANTATNACANVFTALSKRARRKVLVNIYFSFDYPTNFLPSTKME